MNNWFKAYLLLRIGFGFLPELAAAACMAAVQRIDSCSVLHG